MAFTQWIKNFLAKSPRKTKTFDQSITFDLPGTRRETKSSDARLPALMRREKEIVALVRLGHSNKEIAGKLGISVATVKWNMTNILSKFQVETSKQLIVLLSSLDAEVDVVHCTHGTDVSTQPIG